MKLVVLRTGDAAAPVAAVHGEFFAWIQRALAGTWTGEWLEHDVRDLDVPLPAPGTGIGYLVTGSSSSVTEHAPWMRRTEAFVRSLVEAKVPLFGICFGHQLIGEALGGSVARNPRGREIGTVDVRRVTDVPCDPVLEGLPATFAANASHVDTVQRLPPHARVLAETSLEPNAVYAVGDTTRCVQFHPEFGREAMAGYIEARAERIAAEGLDLEAIRSRTIETPHAADILRNFVRNIVLPRAPR